MSDRREQLLDLEEALRHVRRWRRAVDVGAHTGTFSVRMAARFAAVTAFEPFPRYARKWDRRTAGVANIELHAVALGAGAGEAVVGDGPGKPFFLPGPGPIEVRTLDSFRFRDVDLLKIDAEGADALVLAGARKTIKRSRPVIVVEEMPELAARFGLAADAVRAAMDRLGATLIAERAPNLIYGFA